MTAAKEMLNLNDQLVGLGHEIILPEFTHDYAKMETHEMVHLESSSNKKQYDLIRGYFEKIKSVDAVLIANVERKNIPGYIGGNSFLEMGFAHVLNKPIYLLNPIPEIGYQDEIVAMQPIALEGDLFKINDLTKTLA